MVLPFVSNLTIALLVPTPLTMLMEFAPPPLIDPVNALVILVNVDAPRSIIIFCDKYSMFFEMGRQYSWRKCRVCRGQCIISSTVNDANFTIRAYIHPMNAIPAGRQCS